MPRPLVLAGLAVALAGCCDALFRPNRFTTRVYEVLDLAEARKATEEDIADELKYKLYRAGHKWDIGEIRPQKGLIVVTATPEVQDKIQDLLRRGLPK